jgi:hypothetical protein
MPLAGFKFEVPVISEAKLKQNSPEAEAGRQAHVFINRITIYKAPYS